MSMEYDEKGKIFTDIVSKHPLPVLLQTTQQLVRGSIHVRAGERMKDALDDGEPFLAVTDAVILDGHGGELYRAPFLAILRSQIVWAMPQEDEKEGPQ